MSPPPALKRVVLIGFSATGKSILAPFIAHRLGWQAVDLDVEIERTAGRTIPRIFESEGERGFRAREHQAVRDAASRDGVVIATGGGVWLNADNRSVLADGGYVVTLEARSATILARYAAAEQGTTEVRPMLAGADPRRRVKTLKAARQPFYAMSDLTVHTDDIEIEQAVDQVVDAVTHRAAAAVGSDSRLREMRNGPGVDPPPISDFGADVGCIVEAGSARYPVYCAWGLLDRTGDVFDRLGLGGRVFLIADQAVIDSHGATALRSLERTGRSVISYAVPSGRGEQVPVFAGVAVPMALSASRGAQRRRLRARRRRHDRPRRDGCGDLPARHAAGPRTDDRARHGRRRDRRQGGDRPAIGQEPRRCVLPAASGPRRRSNARDTCRRANSARDSRK